MSDIKEKFGTGWIGTGSGSSQRGGTSSSGVPRFGSAEANQTYLTLGKQMVRFLKEIDGVDKLYNLADKMKLGPDDLEPVVEWLANNYYIRVLPDRFGNHEIRLTGKAGELVSA
jgi:hypothetical protein